MKGQTGKEFKNNKKRGKLWQRGLGLGSLLLSVERVSLWATVARHLWGVQVTGLAAKWTRYMFRDQQQVQEGFWGECSRKKQNSRSLPL